MKGYKELFIEKFVETLAFTSRIFSQQSKRVVSIVKDNGGRQLDMNF